MKYFIFKGEGEIGEGAGQRERMRENLKQVPCPVWSPTCGWISRP